MAVTATLKPAASGLRSGFDHQQHEPATPLKATCGQPIREQRYDRPDWPRCMDCIDVSGITVAAPDPGPTELEQPGVWTEPELREAYGR